MSPAHVLKDSFFFHYSLAFWLRREVKIDFPWDFCFSIEGARCLSGRAWRSSTIQLVQSTDQFDSSKENEVLAVESQLASP